jgi:hypothetical protein
MSDKRTYVGIKPCGCKTAAMMVEGFSMDEICEFIESCKQRGMEVELHDTQWVQENYGFCEQHQPVAQKTLF